ncbi:hypothetical protein ACFPQ7_04730 [Methylobacterium iners]|uniref:Uncharacterized protein n=1 Tax=Methylobacterium iners TaxID=418707 RepID=A0ABQ4RQ78_9HYPH|nr:hypothetical protein OCOJLMKI_0094 [Methylobacterium iners]
MDWTFRLAFELETRRADHRVAFSIGPIGTAASLACVALLIWGL